MLSDLKKYGLKKFWPWLKITLKWFQGITLFKDFEIIFAFLLNSLKDHYFGQFLVMFVVFVSDDELIFLVLFETMISQASVSKLFEASKPFQGFKFCLFSPTQPQFSHVCLSSWWEVTRISLAFAHKQALVLGRPGIRNSPIHVYSCKPV